MSLKIVRLSATNEAVVHHVLINLPLKQTKEHVIFRSVKIAFYFKYNDYAFYIWASTNIEKTFSLINGLHGSATSFRMLRNFDQKILSKSHDIYNVIYSSSILCTLTLNSAFLIELLKEMHTITKKTKFDRDCLLTTVIYLS